MIVEKGRTIGRTERKDKNEIMEGQKSVFRGGLIKWETYRFFSSDTKNGRYRVGKNTVFSSFYIIIYSVNQYFNSIICAYLGVPPLKWTV